MSHRVEVVFESVDLGSVFVGHPMVATIAPCSETRSVRVSQEMLANAVWALPWPPVTVDSHGGGVSRHANLTQDETTRDANSLELIARAEMRKLTFVPVFLPSWGEAALTSSSSQPQFFLSLLFSANFGTLFSLRVHSTVNLFVLARNRTPLLFT